MINQVLNNIFYIVQNITSKYNIKYDVKQSIDRVTKITKKYIFLIKHYKITDTM